MFTDLNVFKTAYAMATHAGQRQAVVSENMANADTPSYRARDIVDFARTLRMDRSDGAMRASRVGHVDSAAGSHHTWREITPDMPSDPNGNSVSVELEMFKAVEVKRQHERALAIYQSSLNVLRASLGRG